MTTTQLPTQLRLFPTKPEYHFECPCGKILVSEWGPAVWQGWHLPDLNLKVLEDGQLIIAMCRVCNMPRSDLSHWRWYPVDGDIYHWLKRQAAAPLAIAEKRQLGAIQNHD